MKLEIWMIVGIGIAFALGLGALTVMLLGLHAEVRRLSKLAENAQRMLAANLRQLLPAATVTIGQARPPDPPQGTPDRNAEFAPPPLATLARALAAADTQSAAAVAISCPEPSTGGTTRLDWHPDRRLLVMRLASRGQLPEQIAAALRIPEREVEEFLEANQLLAKRQTTAP